MTGSLPLAGIRVLEVGHIVAGPFAGFILAQLGAEVIKIENPEGGDSARRGNSLGLFYALNAHKKSLSLDLRAAAGRERFFRLCETADVILENLAPGAMTRLGLDYESVRQRSSRIIYCSIKGFLPGPYGDRPLVNELAEMLGGLAYMTGPPGQPTRAGASLVDMGSGTFAVVAIATALFQREHTGQGQEITAGLFETVALWMGRDIVEHQLSGKIPLPYPVRRLALAKKWEAYDRFETKDGRQIVIAFTSDAHWDGLCRALRKRQWREDPRLATRDKRLEAREWLLPVVQEAVVEYERAALVELLAENDVPAVPVNTPADLAYDPHLRAIEQLLPVDVPEGTVRLPTVPFQSSAYDRPTLTPPPRLGEQNGEVEEDLFGQDAHAHR